MRARKEIKEERKGQNEGRVGKRGDNDNNLHKNH